jgi:hypothetical protein
MREIRYFGDLDRRGWRSRSRPTRPHARPVCRLFDPPSAYGPGSCARVNGVRIHPLTRLQRTA